MLSSPECLSLASTVLGGNRPREASCSSLQPPFNIFSSHNVQNQPLSCPQSPGTATIFWAWLLMTHQPSTPRFLRIIPLRWRLPSTPSTTCICRPPKLISLWASISATTMWLWRVWATLFSWIGQGEAQRPRGSLENAKSARGLHAPPRPAEASLDEWGKTKDTMEAAFSWRRIWTRPFWVYRAWVWPAQAPTSVTSWRTTS